MASAVFLGLRPMAVTRLFSFLAAGGLADELADGCLSLDESGRGGSGTEQRASEKGAGTLVDAFGRGRT